MEVRSLKGGGRFLAIVGTEEEIETLLLQAHRMECLRRQLLQMDDSTWESNAVYVEDRWARVNILQRLCQEARQKIVKRKQKGGLRTPLPPVIELPPPVV